MEKYTDKQIEEFKIKADKWDALDKQVGALYFDDEENEIEDTGDTDLGTIGEMAAIALGYL